MKNAAAEGNWKKFTWGYVGLPTIFYLLERGVPSFLLVYFGTAAVDALLAFMPASLMTAFAAVATVLPAIGMAALMGYLVEDIWGIVFFLFGFACYVYLGLSTTAIIFPAIVVAYLYYRTMNKGAKPSEIDESEEII